MAYIVNFIKNGNIKIGKLWSFNKLAGAGVIGGCLGTCGKYCTGCYNAENPKKSPCYVFGSYVRYGFEKSTVVQSHIKNTVAIRENIDKAFNDLYLQIKRARNKPQAVRIHSSGEICEVKELYLWADLASKFPEIPFYVYTKAFDIVDLYFQKGFALPSNFYLNISIWHEVGIDCYNRWKDKRNVRAFVYDDGFDYSKYGLDVKYHCPAYNAKGKMDHRFTCDKCKVCFSKRNAVCACYDH